MSKWEEAWQEGRTGWDAGDSSPILHQLTASNQLPEGRALVPGCGSGYDLLTLASPGRQAIGLDGAPTAKERFQRILSQSPADPDHVDYRLGDFFEFRPASAFDMVWDYTFFCAIKPEKRPAWARKMARLIRPGGQLVALLFPVIEDPKKFEQLMLDGPPFPVVPRETRQLLQDDFELLSMDPVDPELSHEGRQGNEWLARFRRLP